MTTQPGVTKTGSLADQFGWVPTSANLAASLARAQAQAGAQSHRFVTLEHLLFALSDDTDARLVLRSCNVDADRLRQDIAAYLGQLQDRVAPDETAPQAAHEDLLKILRTAAEAARQVKRSQIDGAIVLAALVGEGRSPAAEFLKSYGLTFEAAIRSLQARGSGPGPTEQAKSPADGPATQSDDTDAPTKPIAPAKKVASSPVSPPAAAPVAPDSVAAPPATASQPTQSAEPSPPAPKRKEQTAPTTRRRAPVAETPLATKTEAEEAQPLVDAPAPVKAKPATSPASDFAVRSDHAEIATAPPPPPPAPVRPAPALAPPTPPPTNLTLRVEPQAGETHISRVPAQPNPRPPNNPRPPSVARPPVAPPTTQPAPEPPARASASPVAIPPWPEVAARPAPQPPVPRPGPDPFAGGIAGPPFPSPDAIASPQPAAPQTRRPYHPGRPETTATESGKLVENIPRRMRVAVPCKVEVRVARDGHETLPDSMTGVVHQHALTVTKAMAVRLRAPDGGFHIESGSPETQWIAFNGDPHSTDFAAWHWRVTPQTRGRKRLRLVVSSRTIAADGLTAESTLPDRIVDIRVRANYGLLAQRWGFWLAAMLGGGILGRFGESAFDVTEKLLQRLVGGQ